ncbi:MAG: App1 family protein [Deltaproteobacteria bacterium]|nr:App1 family protein [Deltaproteobacteria bacterium]
MRNSCHRNLQAFHCAPQIFLWAIFAVFSASASSWAQAEQGESVQADQAEPVQAKSVQTKSARIVVFGAFSYDKKIHVFGRVVEDHAVLARRKRGRLANVVENLRSLETDEVRNVDIDVVIAEKKEGADLNQVLSLRADNEGLFHIVAEQLIVTDASVDIDTTLRVSIKSTTHHAAIVELDVKRVSPGSSPVVVSDFDDTLAKSFAANKAKLALEVLSKNASQLVMVKGAAEAFSMAETSPGGGGGELESSKAAAFFYLSSSPLSFFDRIQDFLNLHGFPQGMILLKDYGAESISDPHGYKTRRIEMLLAAMPDNKFVLVGDAGEADPEIYGNLKKKYPTRIQRIVIRIPDDTSDEKKSKKRFEGMTVIEDYSTHFTLLPPSTSD